VECGCKGKTFLKIAKNFHGYFEFFCTLKSEIYNGYFIAAMPTETNSALRN